jgi:hypothetical protein
VVVAVDDEAETGDKSDAAGKEEELGLLLPSKVLVTTSNAC